RDELIRVAESLQPNGASSGESCRADELRLDATGQGAGGALLGGVKVTNTGTRACDVEGRPHVELLRADGTALRLRVVVERPAFPPVRLAPGESAFAIFDLRNWCRGAVDPVNVRVSMSGVGALSAPLSGGVQIARCDAPSLPSTLGVGWFQHS